MYGDASDLALARHRGLQALSARRVPRVARDGVVDDQLQPLALGEVSRKRPFEPFERLVMGSIALDPVDLDGTLLYELEAQRPYLFVDTLEIKPRKARRRAQASEAAAQAPSLLARLDLYGYILAEAGP